MEISLIFSIIIHVQTKKTDREFHSQSAHIISSSPQKNRAIYHQKLYQQLLIIQNS